MIRQFRLQDRESAMLRVVVKDSEKTKQDTFIGQNAIPVTCIRQVLFFPPNQARLRECCSFHVLRKLICVDCRDIDTCLCGTKTITWCCKLASFAGFAHLERIQPILTLLRCESPYFWVSDSVLIFLCVCTDSSLSHFHQATQQQPKSEQRSVS